MALIKCPECGKEVSDRAENCIHCGFPLIEKKNTKCVVNGIERDLAFMLNEDMSLLQKIIALKQLTNVEYNQGKQIVEDIIKKGEIPPYINITRQPVVDNRPKCPTCQSTNIEKISTGKKLFGGAMFGLFSSDVRNQMHCKNCGYKW